MSTAFLLLALLTVAGAVVAMTLRNLVYCALAIAVSFGGLAAIYLQLDAQFVGFAQVLVYVGAVAILILFAILLTRGSEPGPRSIFSGGWLGGVAVATAVFLLLAGAAINSRVLQTSPVRVEPTVRDIGVLLMSKYVLPLQVAGLLLTAALLGAVVLAMHGTGRPADRRDPNRATGASAQ
jgi:NADH:ubiquinone oxidoreductase subunit 6 (subunit J)